jgi:hypothetical protein
VCVRSNAAARHGFGGGCIALKVGYWEKSALRDGPFITVRRYYYAGHSSPLVLRDRSSPRMTASGTANE